MTQNVASLQQTISKNGVTNIVVNQIAVGGSKGELTLYVGANKQLGCSGWASVVPAQERSQRISVDVITIDEYVRARGIDRVRLVKLDIEGHEGDALRGMKELLSQPNAPDLLLEVNPYLLNKLRVDSTYLTSYLARQGYSLFQVNFNSIKLINAKKPLKNMVNLYATKQ